MIKTCEVCEKGFDANTKNVKYCSHDCMIASPTWREGLRKSQEARIANLKKLAQEFVCVGCGMTFTKMPNKVKKGETKYCSLACYRKAPKTSLVRRVACKCEWCGSEREVTPSVAKARRFCSYICWRYYFAERFDRSVHRVWEIGEVQNYDEFLTQEKLPCLFSGCDWSGDNLSMHVNMSHGVTAMEFKELCGFNRGSALVSPERLKQLIAQSEGGGCVESLENGRENIDWSSQGKYQRRPETIEHMKKRYADRRISSCG